MNHPIPLSVRQGVINLLKLKGTEDLLDFTFSSGGCINPGGKLTTTSGIFFLKWNNAVQFPAMFEAEANGLRLLDKVKEIHIPEVIGVGDDGINQFLLLEFVEQTAPNRDYWKTLGSQLAGLHRTSNDQFGLDHSNYIGSLKQLNNPNESWVQFFIHERLEVQLKIAADGGVADSKILKSFEKLFLKLPSLIPEEKPSLLHGDLWSGNLIVNRNGDPCLIDPAVYYGSREMDLAMTRLFGSLPAQFYD
jgi:protein-ribulosamine 3-kinase